MQEGILRAGDELEELANGMNEMADKLDSFYSTLEEQVRERTRELRGSEAKFKTFQNGPQA